MTEKDLGAALPLHKNAAPPAANVIPFALSDRAIFTVESERVLVNVRHRTRWYCVRLKRSEQPRRHLCSSRSDAIAIAAMLTDGEVKRLAAERDPAFQQFCAWYLQQSQERQEQIKQKRYGFTAGP